MATTYGFVNFGSGRKQFTVLEKGNKNIEYGTTLKLGRIERKLEQWNVGDLLSCSFAPASPNTYLKVSGFAKMPFERLSVMNNNGDKKYFVSILSVTSQVPHNIKGLGYFFAPPALIKTAWFVCSETGKPFTIPIQLEHNDAIAAARYILENSNAKAVVLDSSGEVIENFGLFGTALPEKEKLIVVDSTPTQPKEPKTAGSFFYVEESANIVLSAVALKYKAGFTGNTNILVTGDSGTGKTSLAKKLAQHMGWEYHRLNCALIAEPMDIAGQRAIKEGETTWEWSAVAKAIAAGNAVITLDEINRAYSSSLNALFGLLDDDRQTWFNDLELKVGPNVVFFATMNQGSQYTGTFQADAALLNRFQFVFETGDIPKEKLVEIVSANCGVSSKVAGDIAKIGTVIKARIPEIPVSIRLLKAVADAVASGLTQRQAWQFVLVNRVHDSQRRDIVDLLNTNIEIFSNREAKLIF